MAVEVPQNKEISGGGKDGGRKGVGSAIRWRRQDRGGVHINPLSVSYFLLFLCYTSEMCLH